MLLLTHKPYAIACDECPSMAANVISLVTNGEYCGRACLDVGVERHLRSLARVKGDVK